MHIRIHKMVTFEGEICARIDVLIKGGVFIESCGYGAKRRRAEETYTGYDNG